MFLGRMLLAIGGFCGIFSASATAQAWLLHEHVRITAAGIEDAGDSRELQTLWENVRDLAPLLCPTMSTGDRAYETDKSRAMCVGFEGLTALAADHSCSPEDLWKALKSDWVSRVLLESDNMRRKIDESLAMGDQDGSKRREALLAHDIELQLIDPEYATRAKNTLGHFQLLREPGESLDEYLARATNARGPQIGNAVLHQPNALGFYVAYHAAAIRSLVDALRGCHVSSTRIEACDAQVPWNGRRQQILKAILAESLAIHFLEDTFPSGHILGAVGNVSMRKGTHDYYGHRGTWAQPWCATVAGREQSIVGTPAVCKDYVAFGEGFLDLPDLDHARVAAAQSLTEFVLAARSPDHPKLTPWLQSSVDTSKLLGLNSCTASQIPLETSHFAGAARHTAQLIPEAGLRDSGAPRFNSALGWFWAPNMEVAGRLNIAGPRDQKYVVDLPSRLQVGIDLGVLADGLVSGRADGVISAGVLVGASQSPVYGSWSVGSGVRIQLPFTYFPGDAFVLGPVLGIYQLATGDSALTRWALRAADGGLLRLEQRLPLGRGWTVQVVAGRRVALMTSFYNGNRGLENFAFDGKPGVWQLQVPAAVFSTSHITDGVLGYDSEWILGYDISWARGPRDGSEALHYLSPAHGLYLSYAFKARRQNFF